jgi:hypothetical protein
VGRLPSASASLASALTYQVPEYVGVCRAYFVSLKLVLSRQSFRQSSKVNLGRAHFTDIPAGAPVGTRSLFTVGIALAGQVLARQPYHRAVSVVGRANK